MSTTKKKNEQAPIFFPQGFLVYQVAYGSQEGKLKESSLGENGNKYNKVLKLKGNYKPETVVSKLVNVDGTKVDNHLLNLENHKISALVPEVRLFRALEDQNRTVPFYFPVASDFDVDSNGVLNLQNSSFSAGAAVIESFSYSLSGVNPYQVTRKFLNAELRIKVDNLSVLFDQKPGYAALADLFTIRAGAKNTEFLNMGKSASPGALTSGQSCRIIATLGYSVPRDYNMFSSEEIITIEQTKQIINLYYSAHDLEVSQDGSTSVSIKYTGYLETIKEDSNFDFLSNSDTKAWTNRRASKSQETAGDIKTIFSKKDEKNKKNEKPDEEESKKKLDTNEAFSDLITDLFERGKIYSTVFNEEYFDLAPVETDDDEEEEDLEKPGLDRFFGVFSRHTINYFTFGDLIDAYFIKLGRDLDRAIERNKKKKEENSKEDKSDKIDKAIKRIEKSKEDLKLINIYMCDIKGKRKKETDDGIFVPINIADVPISLDNFYTKVWKDINSRGLGYYDMKSFLDFAMSLLNESFDFLQGAQLVEDITYKMVTFTTRELKKRINRGIIDIEDAPKFTDSFSKNSSLSEYILFMQEPAQYSKSPGSGNKQEDTSNGLFHLRPNKDRGFLKNVSFSRISMPAREASLVVGSADLYDELRLPHNAVATMFGNFMFMPGSQVFIDPNTLGFGSVRDLNSAARRLGFGGYYTVENVTTSFSNGRLETTLNLLFNAFPETAAEATLSAQAYKSLKKMTNLMGEN